VFGADEVYSIRELPRRLPQIAAGASALLFDFDRPSAFHFPSVRAAVEGLCAAPGGPRAAPLRPLVQRLRWRKSGGELQLMRASALIAGAAMRRCMAMSRPGVRESELAATFGEIRICWGLGDTCQGRETPNPRQGYCRCLPCQSTHPAPALPAEYECRLAGAPRNAYPPVVAGGADACTIHYSRNDKRVAAGKMVLMDAGCE
jgi:Xaa-Pro aminopeptidase